MMELSQDQCVAISQNFISFHAQRGVDCPSEKLLEIAVYPTMECTGNSARREVIPRGKKISNCLSNRFLMIGTDPKSAKLICI